jgi:hypothetical protein
MLWYNPTRRVMEYVPAPLDDAQAIKRLSGHPGSARFINEYKRIRATHPDIAEALILTGARFYQEHRKGTQGNRARATV